MSEQCENITELFNRAKRFHFPFDCDQLPKDGIYALFERNEFGHGYDRIVRIGTHTGTAQLISRLCQHFLYKNKDRSIFRKNVGRAILNRRSDPYLEIWEYDSTSRANREKLADQINVPYQTDIEIEVSKVIRDSFSFAVAPVYDKDVRLRLESRIISTVSLCRECKPSDQWLGLFSTKPKIRESGLWLVNELYKEPLCDEEIVMLTQIVHRT